MDIYNDHIIQLTKAFEKYNVQYLIVGGFAVIHHGYTRTTGDLDLYLKDTIENRQRLIDAMEEVGYGKLEPLLRAPLVPGYCEVLMDDGMYADLMSVLPGLKAEDFDEHFQMASIANIDGVAVRFLHYNLLIRNKIATGRAKDLADVAALEAIHKTNNQ